MARTNRFASTTADVQARMARVNRIERVTDEQAIRDSLAELFDTDADSIVRDDAHVFTYTSQTPVAIDPAVRESVHNDVIAMGDAYEYMRACAEHSHKLATKIEMFPVSLTAPVRTTVSA